MNPIPSKFHPGAPWWPKSSRGSRSLSIFQKQCMERYKFLVKQIKEAKMWKIEVDIVCYWHGQFDRPEFGQPTARRFIKPWLLGFFSIINYSFFKAFINIHHCIKPYSSDKIILRFSEIISKSVLCCSPNVQ